MYQTPTVSTCGVVKRKELDPMNWTCYEYPSKLINIMRSAVVGELTQHISYRYIPTERLQCEMLLASSKAHQYAYQKIEG